MKVNLGISAEKKYYSKEMYIKKKPSHNTLLMFLPFQNKIAKFQRNPLSPRAGSTFNSSIKTIMASNIIREKESKFQAHSLNISSKDEAQEGLAAFISKHPRATHRVYAYRLAEAQSGRVITGHSDDGEWGTSKYIMVH